MFEWLLSGPWSYHKLVERRDALQKALEAEIARAAQLVSEAQTLQANLQVERAHRVAAESISVARGDEIQRLLSELQESRQSERSIRDERMKSLDTLNLRLMESRVEAPPPDMSQYHAAAKLKTQMIDDIRRRDRAMDMLLLQRYHPAFKPKPANAEAPAAEGG
jgi:hypothetical protein